MRTAQTRRLETNFGTTGPMRRHSTHSRWTSPCSKISLEKVAGLSKDRQRTNCISSLTLLFSNYIALNTTLLKYK